MSLPFVKMLGPLAVELV
jgi:hypothetical protein